jgi:hypothetical protein
VEPFFKKGYYMKIGSWVLFTVSDNRSFGKIVDIRVRSSFNNSDSVDNITVITEDFETEIIYPDEILEEVEEENVYQYLSSKFSTKSSKAI